ncbi:TonB-dependent receptor [Ketobacter sp.]|uniref:TonB-dependent receptor n=1 Tax=Ketobacter sp. TaxID=2083498 RepID=UPI000F118852|nr:TonB-dependent receptor [Ketobacter sp.]RLU00619.1 MAG: TonB-dependent siderophore receptor [Ketobacter sp.]
MPVSSRKAQLPLSLRQPSAFGGLNTRKTTLALGISALMFNPVALAQEEEEAVDLDTLQIEDSTIDTNPYAEPGAPYKAKVSGDQRHVKPLAETPQTINVLTGTMIEESGRTDLKEILQAQPGVTIGTGENGNAFGDRYIIRGHEARSDVFVDGLRDPGMTTRESFATEQVEITKGPSSTFGGRGTTGGAVNSITKQASTEYNFTELSGGVGTDNYYRGTVDSNLVLSDTVAVRANLLQTAEDVPDRAPADRERTGAALSASFQATDKLNVIADYYYLKAQDRPDLGTYIMPNGGKPVKDIPAYAQEEDFQDSEINAFTLRLGYDINDQLRVTNALRYGTTDNGYVTTGARGTNRDTTDPDAPGAYTVGLSTHQGWQEAEYFVDQLNFYFDTVEASGIAHSFIFGLEYSDYKVLNGIYEVNNLGATNCVTSGRGGARPNHCIMDPNGDWVSNPSDLMQRDINKDRWDSDWNIETISASVMDTIDFSTNFSMFLGVRYDLFDYSLDLQTIQDDKKVVTPIRYDDGFWNGHVGLVYDVAENGNVYLTWSTATNISGGESDVGNNCGYGGFCGIGEPEDVTNWELGTKWNLFDQKLLATLAVFRIEKDNVMEGGGYGAEDASSNTAANRVRGVEASFVGNITEKLSGQFGVAVMKSEVLESVNEDNVGRALSNFADDSAFLQLRYQLLDQFAFGGTATYKSEMYAGQPDTAAGWNDSIDDYSYTVPSYTVFDVFAEYDITDDLNARLNVTNVTDKDYYLAAYRSGAFTYIGDARRAVLTFTYQM